MMTTILVGLLLVAILQLDILRRIQKARAYRVLVVLTINSIETNEDGFPKQTLGVRRILNLPLPPTVGMQIGDDGVDDPLKLESVIVREGVFVARCSIAILLNSFNGQKIQLRGTWEGVDDEQ